MAIQSVELCVVRGDNSTLTFSVGTPNNAIFVVQLRPDEDIIRRSLTTDPGLVTISDGTLSVDILTTDFDNLADTALTVARYSLITESEDAGIGTLQTGNFKIFRHPQ